MRTYYTEYVNHMLRHYFRTSPEDNCENCKAVKEVISTLTPEHKDILRAVYERGDVVSYGVLSVAEREGVSAGKIYRFLSTVSRQIAIERGLV